jgi:osmotically inducible protein OsmC
MHTVRPTYEESKPEWYPSTRKEQCTMPIAERTAQVIWDGSLAGGRGTVESGSGALSGLPVTWAARTETPEGKTSPEELVAAAHATCFTMALALVLSEANTPPAHIATSASCVLDEVDGAPRITSVGLRVHAQVEALDEAGFNGAVGHAAALCPVSNALRDNVEISVAAFLDTAA